MIFQLSLAFELCILYVNAWILGPNPTTFDQAEAYCASYGIHLATIKDSIDRDETKALCQANALDQGAEGCLI